MARKEIKRRTARVQADEAAAVPAGTPDVSNLGNCVEEVRQAALDGDTGPPDPTDFNNLRGRLEAARTKLPPLYRDEVFRPYVQTLNGLGPSQFVEVLLNDPVRERTAGLMLDIAHAPLFIAHPGDLYRQRTYVPLLMDEIPS